MDTFPTEIVRFELDGKSIEALPDETILQAAQRTGAEIPYLCYKDGYRPDGNCRACVVEIDGERVLAPSCCRNPTEGMQVSSQSERARHSQKMVVELLLSDMPEQGKSPYTQRSELDVWAEKLGVAQPRFEGRHQPQQDMSHPAMAVQLDACIQCTRCVRACREVQVNDVIGYANRGDHSAIVFDLNDEMGASTCVACGECVQACPTGALMPAENVGLEVPDKQVESTCPYCGVGCLLTYNVKENRILSVEGREGPANKSRLCVKGRFGFDYVHHPERLTQPLIRREGVPKTVELLNPSDFEKVFRPATWEEALDVAANGLKRIREDHGSSALAGFGCAKGSNEEAYLLQKLVRTGFGNNNIDHCTRLCHASSVVALLEGIGSGAVSNPFTDADEADVIMVVGSNTSVNHPVAATFFKNAAQAGKDLILLDPRRIDIARYASYSLQFNPDTDVALFNALMHTIVEEGLCNEEYIAQYTEGFDALKENLKDYSPEAMAKICGIPAETLREVARRYATAKSSIIFWGMGVSQHVHGTDNARCLIALALMTGQIGRPGTGLHPLRGQNNVQGASDMGLIPMVFPDYKPVGDPEAKQFFEELWGMTLDPNPGLTVVEITEEMHERNIKGLYIMGENPAMSDPNLNHTREALARLEHFVIQDIFPTETAGFADVILPTSAFPEKTGTFTNTNRQVQLGRQALDPPGDSRQDWWIIQEMANRLGLSWNYRGVPDIFAEIRKATPSMAGITWERLEQDHSVTYPCENEGDPGDPVIFTDGFPTANGRATFVPAQFSQADELPDGEYPYVFITGRQLEHWHTGSMTRRAGVLDAIEPLPVVNIHPSDLDKLGVEGGTPITVQSRRGQLTAFARGDHGVPEGNVYMAFSYNEAAANLITTDMLDPFGKIPEFKFCAVQLSAGGDLAPRLA
ncbi:MAG: formate dehydrogenase subunit alpha [SAR324 cluster bacterium]|nr:formate dehydrogenase subunit alpha [SAR324 cluster bacterium]